MAHDGSESGGGRGDKAGLLCLVCVGRSKKWSEERKRLFRYSHTHRPHRPHRPHRSLSSLREDREIKTGSYSFGGNSRRREDCKGKGGKGGKGGQGKGGQGGQGWARVGEGGRGWMRKE
jgi:hypothetical protein